jgi:hypothetical protein
MIENLTTMNCCLHIPDNCYVKIIQKNGGAPFMKFENMPKAGMMEMSFNTVRILCPACFLISGGNNK